MMQLLPDESASRIKHVILTHGEDMLGGLLVAMFLMIWLGFPLPKPHTPVIPAHDQQRRADIKMLGEALEAYARSNSGSYRVTGAGSAGTGIGFANLSYDGLPSLVAALVAKGLLAKDVADPGSSTGYMIYLCDNGRRYAVWATLDRPSSVDETAARSKCNALGPNGAMDIYGKNLAVGN